MIIQGFWKTLIQSILSCVNMTKHWHFLRYFTMQRLCETILCWLCTVYLPAFIEWHESQLAYICIIKNLYYLFVLVYILVINLWISWMGNCSTDIALHLLLCLLKVILMKIQDQSFTIYVSFSLGAKKTHTGKTSSYSDRYSWFDVFKFTCYLLN